MLELVKNPNFDFIGFRKIALWASLTVIVLTMLILALRGGPRYGIDFTGGAAITFSFQQEVSAEEVRQALAAAGEKSYEVTHFGDKRHVLVRLKVLDTTRDYLTPIQQQFDQRFQGNTYTVDQNDLVGPKIGTELREKALLALLFSWIGIIIYISIRFEAESFLGVLGTLVFGLIVLSISQAKAVLSSDILTLLLMAGSLAVMAYICVKFNFKYAVGAIAALIHDVFFTLGLLTLMNVEVDLTIIAALLTIVGYSLNDTIVLFDRVREEYPKERKHLPMDTIINNCVNHVLSRTIITAGTTLLAVIVLLFFGGEVIRPFALAMTIGIIVGTYSSIYISAPVLIYWQEKFGKGQELAGKKVQA
ncbi:protein translocase subunit SecF [bacterium]|nr:protein translocase subunit SecF [bacterium]